MNRDSLINLVTIVLCLLQGGNGLFSERVQTVVLSGEAGVGKTSFIRHLIGAIIESGYTLGCFILRGMTCTNATPFMSARHPLNVWLNENNDIHKILIVEEIK